MLHVHPGVLEAEDARPDFRFSNYTLQICQSVNAGGGVRTMEERVSKEPAEGEEVRSWTGVCVRRSPPGILIQTLI